LTNVAGVLTPVRPEATLVGTVTITISVGIEEFVKIIDVSIKRAASESFDFEAAITGMGTSYLDINDIVLNGTTGLSLDIHRVAQTTPTGKTNKALVISPRTGTVSGGASDGIAFAAFDYGTKIINEVEFDIYFWNSSAEAFFTKIELQAKVDGVWVTVMDLKAVITGSVNTFHIVANGLNTSEFRIYTEGGKLNANDARVCIDNLEIYTAPIE
jgi:hypothetical protein